MKKLRYFIPILLLLLSSCDQNINSSINDSSSSVTFEDSSSISSSNGKLSYSLNTDYYDNINLNATGATLMNELHKLIKNHNQLKYTNLKNYYPITDVKDGKVWDMYSNYKYDFSDCTGRYKKEGDGWNKEHSIPKAWFKEAAPMESDIFHIYPTDGVVNNRRDNYPYGEVVKATYTSGNGCKLGTDSNGKTVFEPIDEYKEDFARTYFYFATCYMDKSINNGNGSTVFTSSNSYPKLTQSSIDLFMKWAEMDPVSQKEIDRNNACYIYQKNRNPFIDFPEFATQIWG